MFKKRLKKRIRMLEEERFHLQDQVERLELQKKINEEDIKHLARIKEEKLEIAYRKKAMKLQQEKDEEIATIKNEYRNKIEKRLEDEVKRIKDMYADILSRLPNINVKLKGEVS